MGGKAQTQFTLIRGSLGGKKGEEKGEPPGVLFHAILVVPPTLGKKGEPRKSDVGSIGKGAQVKVPQIQELAIGF